MSNEQRNTEKEVIGKTSSTRNQANSSDEFYFWIKPEVKVNPTDIVKVKNRDGTETYGLVLNIENYTDSASHIDNFVSSDFGNVDAKLNTERLNVNIAKCAVLENSGGIYMPVTNNENVYFAEEDDILRALGLTEILQNEQDKLVPAGIIELSNGLKTKALIDIRYLIGPEGAHLNISGISGLATKTSYMMFLSKVLIEKFPKDVAIIVFNVKHDDLLYIDKPSDSLSDEDRKDWDILGIKPEPFTNVKYFLPRGTNAINSFANYDYSNLPPNVKIYSYDLNDTKGKLSYLFVNIEDPRETLAALIHDIEMDLERGYIPIRNSRVNVNSFEDLIRVFSNLLHNENGSDNRSRRYRDHYPQTVGKFLRLLRRFVQTNTSGLFVNNKSPVEVSLAHYIRTIRPGQIYVIDIARLYEHEQAFVVGDVMNEVYRLYAGDVTYRDIPYGLREEIFGKISDDELDNTINPPRKLIFVIDELNKYAPSGKENSPILEKIIEIAERGRSLGIVLFGAQQFASKVHHRVYGNCSNKVYGRMDSTELSHSAYSNLSKDLKTLITKLEKGKLILQHPLYRHPVQIRFPKPPYKQPGH